MRSFAYLLVAATLLAGCSAPGGKGIPLANTGSSLKANSIVDKEADIEDILSYLQSFSDDDMTFNRRLVISDEASPSADMNKNGEITILEVLYQIKKGAMAVESVKNKPTVIMASGPTGNSKFATLLKQRDYYAGNPDNGLGMSGNAGKVAELNERLIELAFAQADSDDPETKDLLSMRSYYNDSRKPPFDGLTVQDHQAHVAKVCELLFKLGAGHESRDILIELREFYGTNPNDGQSFQGHYARIQQINDAIDQVSGLKNAALRSVKK